MAYCSDDGGSDDGNENVPFNGSDAAIVVVAPSVVVPDELDNGYVWWQ
jgi:hypothetical protein